MMAAMCGVLIKYEKRSKDMMLMLGLHEASDCLALAKSVPWYCHVLRMEDCHGLRRAIHFDKLKVKGRKGICKGQGRSRLRKKA